MDAKAGTGESMARKIVETTMAIRIRRSNHVLLIRSLRVCLCVLGIYACMCEEAGGHYARPIGRTMCAYQVTVRAFVCFVYVCMYVRGSRCSLCKSSWSNHVCLSGHYACFWVCLCIWIYTCMYIYILTYISCHENQAWDSASNCCLW